METPSRPKHMRFDQAENAPTRTPMTKSNASGVVLIPQPSERPEDPLNWSFRKKYGTLFVISWAGFAAISAPAAHQTAYVVISSNYEKTPTQLSYSISAAIAGILGGTAFVAPLARLVGRTSLIFWSLIGNMITQIWAANMTGTGDYVPFVISRTFSGLFTSMPVILGAGYIMDIFYLHQRGRAFACYELSFLLGGTVSPTIGGFIVEQRPWPWVFWWTLIPLGLAILLVVSFVEETGPLRNNEDVRTPHAPESFMANRIATLLPGTAVVPRNEPSKFLKSAALPFIIAATPMSFIPGFYTLVTFGLGVLINAELAIFLQSPIAAGGYGFSPSRNAAFTFTFWFALVVAQMVGTLCNDRIPVWASRRYGKGIWQPEYRLWSFLIPGIISPIGLGIFGIALEYHLHFMVLALAAFLTELSIILAIPICINYVVECFTGYIIEVAVSMGIYRLALAVSVTFYFRQWSEAVGVGWLFGMAAFFSLFVLLMMGLLAWKGHVFRRVVLIPSLATSEEGEIISASLVQFPSHRIVRTSEKPSQDQVKST